MVAFAQPNPENSRRQSSSPKVETAKQTVVDALVAEVRGDYSPANFAETLNLREGELSTFQTYRLMEVVLLSDRDLSQKRDLLGTLGKYIAKKADPFREFMPTSDRDEQKYLQIVEQVRTLLGLCTKMLKALDVIEAHDSDSKQRSGMAGLQDQVRIGYQQRGIPVEDRTGYTDLNIPGRDFMTGTMKA